MKVKKETRKPSSRAVKEAILRRDLEKFRAKALELGATAAVVVPASDIVVEERVRMKCLVPRCGGLREGGTPYCPPNTPPPDFMRKVFSQYRWAVLFRRDIENLEDYFPVPGASKPAKTAGDFHKKTFEIVGELESYAQSEGYDLAMGFSGGSCRASLCGGATCGVVQNGTCRWPLRARPSMEAVGIDVFDLAGKVGWDTYMVRFKEPDPSVIPCAVSIGIVFIY